MKLDLVGGGAWSPSQGEYELMIQGIYMTLGIMMNISAKNLVKNSMFIWFVVWSSVVHAGIMTYQAAIATDEMGHFMGDIPVLIILALVLGYSLKKAEEGIDLDTPTC